MSIANPLEYRRGLLKGLTDEGLEHLILRMVKEEFPDAHMVRGTDGGIDVFSDLNIPPKRGWQAKNFDEETRWTKCAASLKSAMKNYGPPHYTIVFPFKLTKGQRDHWIETFYPTEFEKYPDLETLDYIDDLAERLEDHPKLVDTLANGALSEYVAPIVKETAASGINPVGTVEDVMTRSMPVAGAMEAAEARDPGYEYDLQARPAREKDAEMGESGVLFLMERPSNGFPTFSVTLRDGSEVVEVTSTGKKDSAAVGPTVVFDDTAEGQQIFHRARASICRGTPFVAEGGHFGLRGDSFPQTFQDELDETDTLREGEITLGISPPLKLRVKLKLEGEEKTAALDIHRIPGASPETIAYGGIFFGARITLDFEPTDADADVNDGNEHEMRVAFSLALDPTGIKPMDAFKGLGFLQAFGRSQECIVQCEDLFPEEGLDFPPPTEPGNEHGFNELATIATALQIIEANTGQEMTIPTTVSNADLYAAQLLIQIFSGRAVKIPIGEPSLIPVVKEIGPDTDPEELLNIEVNLPSITGVDPQVSARQTIEDARAIEIVGRETNVPKLAVEPTSENSQLVYVPLTTEE